MWFYACLLSMYLSSCVSLCLLVCLYVYVCMYVFIYVCMYVPTYVRMYVCMKLIRSAHIHRHRLRWVGHVIRLDDDRIPKQLLYGELSVGSRPQHKPKKRFKDCVKDSLALCKIDDPDWEMVACDRNRWRKMMYSGSRCFQDNANIWAKTNRAARKGDNIDPDLSQFVCQECGRVCFSSAA